MNIHIYQTPSARQGGHVYILFISQPSPLPHSTTTNNNYPHVELMLLYTTLSAINRQQGTTSMISKGQTKRSPASIDLEGRVADSQNFDRYNTMHVDQSPPHQHPNRNKQPVALQKIHHRKTSFCVSFRPIVCLYPLPDLFLPGLSALLVSSVCLPTRLPYAGRAHVVCPMMKG